MGHKGSTGTGGRTAAASERGGRESKGEERHGTAGCFSGIWRAAFRRRQPSAGRTEGAIGRRCSKSAAGGTDAADAGDDDAGIITKGNEKHHFMDIMEWCFFCEENFQWIFFFWEKKCRSSRTSAGKRGARDVFSAASRARVSLWGAGEGRSGFGRKWSGIFFLEYIIASRGFVSIYVFKSFFMNGYNFSIKEVDFVVSCIMRMSENILLKGKWI